MVVERWIARRGQRNSRVGSIRRRLVAPGMVLLCVATLALGTCDSPSESRTTIRTDSAGIPITTALAPQWGSGEGWTISEEPLLEIGAVDGSDEYLLDGVIGAVRLSNGDIVLGEWASGELRRYDRNGTFMWRTGGQGEGPGEHAFLTFVGSLPGDSVVTYDGALGRVQIFGPEGVVARTMRIESPWSGFPPTRVVGVSERRLVMTFRDLEGEIPVGVVRWPGIRITTFSLDDGAVATLMDIPGAEQYITRTESSITYRGYEFGRGPQLAMTGGRLALVDTEVFSVRSVSLDDGATTAILRRDELAREVTSEDVEAYVEWMARRNVAYGGYSEEQAEASKPVWRKAPMAPTLPVLGSIRLDAAGNLWVEPFAVYGSERSPFEVYAPDGTWLGSVATPPGLILAVGRENTGMEIGEDYVLGVWSGEQGVEYVRMYGLEK